ncbi:hypothetical protein DYADSP32_1200, partial [Dyadobacter sp. 32]
CQNERFGKSMVIKPIPEFLLVKLKNLISNLRKLPSLNHPKALCQLPNDGSLRRRRRTGKIAWSNFLRRIVK